MNTITSTTTGRIWQDRNIGAQQVATAFDDKLSYGNLLTWDQAEAIAKQTKGFRLPTIEEVLAEKITDRNDAFNKLKLPSAGYYSNYGKCMYFQGSVGHLWSSTIIFYDFNYLLFGPGYVFTRFNDRCFMHSVRLIKENPKK